MTKQILKIYHHMAKICSKKCKSLVSMEDSGVEDWVLPNVTEARSFFNVQICKTVDLSKWNPQNIVNLQFSFYSVITSKVFVLKVGMFQL